VAHNLQYPTGSNIAKQRINDQIRVSPVSVVNQDGTMLGAMSTAAARQLAADVGLDLVEVAPDARPPVCRIMDHGKSQYQRKRKQGEGSKTHRTIETSSFTGQDRRSRHRLQRPAGRNVLARKDKVKINVTFRGRENAHQSGREMLDAILETLQSIATVEKRAEHGKWPRDDRDTDAQTLIDPRCTSFPPPSSSVHAMRGVYVTFLRLCESGPP
jgi:translation initiation factor IF-3